MIVAPDPRVTVPTGAVQAAPVSVLNIVPLMVNAPPEEANGVVVNVRVLPASMTAVPAAMVNPLRLFEMENSSAPAPAFAMPPFEVVPEMLMFTPFPIVSV